MRKLNAIVNIFHANVFPATSVKYYITPFFVFGSALIRVL